MNVKHPSAPRVPQQQTHIRNVPLRQQPNAPRMASDRFGRDTNVVVHESWEPTAEVRWFVGPTRDGVTPDTVLQQRWLCKQKSNSRARPVEIRAEWRDVELILADQTAEPVR